MPLCGLQMAGGYLRLMGKTHMHYLFLQTELLNDKVNNKLNIIKSQVILL